MYWCYLILFLWRFQTDSFQISFQILVSLSPQGVNLSFVTTFHCAKCVLRLFSGKLILCRNFLPCILLLWGSVLAALALISWVDQSQPRSYICSSAQSSPFLEWQFSTIHMVQTRRRLCYGLWPWVGNGVSTTILDAWMELCHPLFLGGKPSSGSCYRRYIQTFLRRYLIVWLQSHLWFLWLDTLLVV